MKNKQEYSFKDDLLMMLKLMVLGILIGSIIIILNGCVRKIPTKTIDYKIEDVFVFKDNLRKNEYNTTKIKDTNGKY